MLPAFHFDESFDPPILAPAIRELPMALALRGWLAIATAAAALLFFTLLCLILTAISAPVLALLLGFADLPRYRESQRYWVAPRAR